MSRILAALLLLQAAPPQSEADKLEAALKKFGDRKYRIVEKGKETGTLALKTEFEDKDGRRIVTFEDRFETKTAKGNQVLTVTEQSAMEGLRLQWTLRSHTGPLREDDLSIKMRGTDAYVSAAGNQLIIRDAEEVIGEQAILRLVCAKEQKVGVSFSARRLTLEPVDYQEKRKVRCVSKETLEVGGRKVETFKWEDKHEGTARLAADAPVKIDNAYWVGPDGYLVRIKLGDTEMILDVK